MRLGPLLKGPLFLQKNGCKEKGGSAAGSRGQNSNASFETVANAKDEVQSWGISDFAGKALL